MIRVKSKQYAYATRNGKMSEVKHGSLVLVKQDKENKLSTRFKPQLFKLKDK